MRILALTNLYPRVGRETFAPFHRQQFRALAADHDVVVIAPVPWGEALSARWKGLRIPADGFDAEGIRVCWPIYFYPPKVLRHRYGEFYQASVRRTFERLVRERRPDVVLACWAHPDGWAAVRLARSAGLPVVIKVVGTDVLVATRDARRRERIAEAVREADAVVAVSRDLADRVAGLGAGPDRVHVVHEGLDMDLFRPGDRVESRRRLGLPREGRLVLFVGNLLVSKGAALLVEACRLLADRGLEFRCHLVGRGRDEDRIRALVDRLGLGGRVAFAGARPLSELPDWYRSADLLALPSDSEGIPNVVREASACGCPVVATRVGGIPEVADHEANRLVPVGDVSALAEALAGVLLEAPLPPLEVAARARNITWGESAAELADVLKAACEGWGTRHPGREGAGGASFVDSLVRPHETPLPSG